jgi:hypothetical protein|tara:strand:+ start:210 stop:731 length:522 start_codon:yes stop_codon:yes gene_type:complete
MSYIYDDFDEEIIIKPNLIAKIPFQFFKNNLAALDFFISMSPGLVFLKNERALIISIQSNNTMFYTNKQYALKEYHEQFSENIAVCNLVLFAEEWKKRNNTTITPEPKKFSGPPNTLKTLLNELHQDDENFDCDRFNPDYFNPTFPIEKGKMKKIESDGILKNLIARKRRGDF